MEITETTIMAAGSDDTLAKLNRAGIQLSIDDFGTGYSSLSYLGRLPVKIIKIDRSFVIGIRNTAGSIAIVRSIIELSHSLDLQWLRYHSVDLLGDGVPGALMAGQEQSWWTIRMIVEVTSVGGTFSRFEDRMILVRAGDEKEAQDKGEGFAADYEKTSSWKVRKIVDISEILDRVLGDGTEIYSAFIARE